MKSFPFAIRALFVQAPDPAIEARTALDQMANEAVRARMIRQAGLEAVAKALDTPP